MALSIPIDSEFKNSRASTLFYSVASPLTTDQSSLHEHTVVLTSFGQLIELIDGKLKRIEAIGYKTAEKILVHHEFNPVERFLVILSEENVCTVLKFATLEKTFRAEGVQNIASTDCDDNGRPSLVLTYGNGTTHKISREELYGSAMTKKLHTTDSSIALQNRLLDCKLVCYSSEREKQSKEMLISQQLRDFSVSLKNGNVKKHNGSSKVSFHDNCLLSETKKSSQLISNEANTVQICAVQQRIVHEQLVVCITIMNISDTHAVSDASISLHLNGDANFVSYQSCAIHSTQRCLKNTGVLCGVGLNTQQPNVLMPQKKMSLLAICPLSAFICGPEDCSGLICYSLRPLNPSGGELMCPLTTCQIPVLNFSVSLTTIEKISLKLHEGTVNAVSVDMLCVIAASMKYTVLLESFECELHNFEEWIRKEKFGLQMPDIANHFCCNASTSELLHNVLFSFKIESSNTVELTIYAKNDCQGLLFLASLLSILPKNTFVSPLRKKDDNDCISMEQSFLEAVDEILKVLLNCDKEETFEDGDIAIQSTSSNGNKRKHSSQCINSNWRRTLQNAHCQLDKIFIEFCEKHRTLHNK